MSEFLDNLDMRLIDDYDSRPQFSLLAPFRYQSDFAKTTFTVPQDFSTDGASIPQIAMSFTGYPGMRAAVVHDYLVTNPEVIVREYADQVFHEALLVCGVNPATAQLMYSAVAGYTQQLRKQASAGNMDGGA